MATKPRIERYTAKPILVLPRASLDDDHVITTTNPTGQSAKAKARLAGLEGSDMSYLQENTTEALKRAAPVRPPRKIATTISFSTEVLDFFQKDGPGYQTRINAVLLMFVRNQSRGK